MECPDCRAPLSPHRYQDVNIHHCSACDGKLLVETKLQKIEKSRDASISRAKRHSKSPMHEGLRTCPVCKVHMKKSKYGKYFPRTIDKCPRCNIIWLDKGELEDIQVAYEMYRENHEKGATLTLEGNDRPEEEATSAKKPGAEFKCPKCGFAQARGTECQACGIIYAKYEAFIARQAGYRAGPQIAAHNPDTSRQVRIPRGLGTYGMAKFIRDEIKNLPGIQNKPSDGIESFNSRLGYAFSLAFKEKEIFVFVLLQWAAIGIAYLLWVQMLDWIPEEVWRSAANSRNGSPADFVLLGWSFVCVGLAAYPVGILTGCMGTVHFLHKQGRESTVAMCLKLVVPRSWCLWMFHWIDGWITVKQIMQRLPKENDNQSAADKALKEALYYAWKLGVAGILPSILTGNNLIKSGRNSIIFVKDNFAEVAKLRAGYSALCWIVGIGAYFGSILFFISTDLVPKGGELYQHIYTIYFWMAVPILVAVGVVMLVLRPIYVLALCDLYSEYLDIKREKVRLPRNPPKSVSALVAFCILCIFVALVFGYRQELGINDLLSTPYAQN